MSFHIMKNESTQTTVNYKFINTSNKPIVIYYFVDPFCLNCWSLELYIKKLNLEFGRLFTVRPIIGPFFQENSTRLANQMINTMNTTPLRHENHQFVKYCLSIGIKAAGLQGNKAGRDFLQKVQETLFLSNYNESIENTLIHCAESIQLDVEEFKQDLFSTSAQKAYNCDIKIMKEMDVNQLPTLVFFSEEIEDYSVMVSGLHSYETYIYLLKDMLRKDPMKMEKPPLEILFQQYNRFQLDEIAFIYDWTLADAKARLKDLQLNKIVRKINIFGKPFWEYSDIKETDPL